MAGIQRQQIHLIAILSLWGWMDTAQAAPTTYVLDQAHSTVRFVGRAMGHRFTGTAHAVEGTLVFDPEQEALIRPADILIPVAALETGHAGRDQDMRHMFEADRYPALRFTLVKVTRLFEGPSDSSASRRYQLSGRLQIRSIEQPVAFEVLATVSPERIEASGHVLLTTTAFALTPPRLMFGLVRVHQDVLVTVESQWNRQP